MGRMRDAARSQAKLLLKFPPLAYCWYFLFSPALFFFFFFWGWPKVRAYKKKIHTLGRRSVGLSVLADLVVSEACLKCLSISTGRRLLRMQLLENFSHAKQCYSCCFCCCCRRSGVNFPWAQIILDYEAKQVNVN